jgi:TolB protein
MASAFAASCVCVGVWFGCVAPPEAAARDDWRAAEDGILANHVQLTFAERFVKAGESYFSPDGSKIIFQAVEQPSAGTEPAPFYAMFVADVVRDGSTGRITGIAKERRISPPKSANTCGWFHPADPNVVIFGSTVGEPSPSEAPGFQRQSGIYKWMFPPEMKIVRVDLRRADGSNESLETLFDAPGAYDAECSFSPDGRHLIYCSLASNEGDLFAYDITTGRQTRLVGARGYDGGPFFSPDGRRITYRSDRTGDNLLQLFVADLAFNEQGAIVGIEREYQLTDNGQVNWAPYWHPDGRHLIYTSSQVGHHNYEVFIVDADPGNLPGSNGTIRYGTKHRRITHTREGVFDGLPVFDASGRVMMWTSQRGADGESQLWAADFVMDAEAPAATRFGDASGDRGSREIEIRDPESGDVYYYNPATHEVMRYDRDAHRKIKVTDDAELQRVIELSRRGG